MVDKLVITLTQQALEKLKTMELGEGEYPRIDANMAGGCGVTVAFSLIVDEARRNDTIIEYGGIQIRIDHFTKRYLEDETQIDYTEEHGFFVRESLASSVCAIEIE